MIGKMGLFVGYVWWVWEGEVGAPKGQKCGNWPSQVWMSWDEAEKVDWEGILGWHDMTILQRLWQKKESN